MSNIILFRVFWYVLVTLRSEILVIDTSWLSALWVQVLTVVQKTKSLRKISFLAHSLGGLFARYAIGLLYSSKSSNELQHNTVTCDQNFGKSSQKFNTDTIAGLEPINFITLATPHLGVKGKKQVSVWIHISY